jgi:hypothetical protein
MQRIEIAIAPAALIHRHPIARLLIDGSSNPQKQRALTLHNSAICAMLNGVDKEVVE